MIDLLNLLLSMNSRYHAPMPTENKRGLLGKIVVAGALAALVLGVATWAVWIFKPPLRQTAVAAPPPPSLIAPITHDTMPAMADSSTDEDAVDYAADFDSGTRPPEFSAGSVRKTRQGNRSILGRFNEKPVTFTLENSPPHEFIHVVFDLALLNSWNGSSAYWGPDIWTCRLVDGPELMKATFCNCGFFSNNNEQSYPDLFPIPKIAASYPAWTGAAEHETLGEMRHFSNTQPAIDRDCSSVYHMDWTFPHTGARLALRFKSSVKDKSMMWGLLNFHAATITHAPTLTDAALNSAWADLTGTDAVAANAAVWRFTGIGDQAIDFMQNRADLIPKADVNTDAAAAFRQARILHVLQVIDSAKAHSLRTKMESIQAEKRANWHLWDRISNPAAAPQ